MPSKPSTTLAPLKSIRITAHPIPAHGHIPNSSATGKPLLHYHRAFPSPSASTIEAHLTHVGVVAPRWRYTIYPTSHFHSTAHEVLVVSRGRARLRFGGDANPDAVVAQVEPGDAVIVPAGVAHRMEEDQSGGVFEMVGAYPVQSEHWDMNYGRGGEDHEGIVERIREIGWFDRDPFYGDEGPVLQC
ncbi:hypothetical protein B0H21DRAFT_83443 [Amylocystis lapponica]|nr:hypothetical protein B0H21DRAFT_83443 [Amylocystis lapponica]